MPICTSRECCSSKQQASSNTKAASFSSEGSKHYKWFIRGMDCGNCATKIEKALLAINGVQQAYVAFATERLLIELNANQTPDTIKKVIKELGYTLQETGQDDVHQPLWKSNFTFFLLGILIVAASLLNYIAPNIGYFGFYLATATGIIPFAKKAIYQIKNGTWFGIETLMTVASCGALFLGETFEALMVLLLFSLGEMLEGFAKQKAQAGITNLMKLAPDIAIKLQGNERVQVSASFLQQGETIEVRPGDRLPVDSKVYSSKGLFDESALTGESMPVLRKQGETVMAGSLVIDHPVQLRVVSTPGNNAIDRIITLIEQAESNRAPIARMIDTFSAWYTPLVMAGAALVMLIPPLLFGDAIQPWAYKALTLLLIACPCALVISIPAAVTSALASASRFGALIKGGATLEQLRLLKVLAFDKTGTLTEGKPKITTVIPFGLSEEHLLQQAASIEQGSNHPLAKAIVSEAENRKITKQPARDIQVVNGQGVHGLIDGQIVSVVSPRYIPKHLITPAIGNSIKTLEHKGNSVVVVQQDQQILGLIGLADVLRHDAIEAVTQLKAIGVKAIMLTGDNSCSAAAIADTLGIDYRAELSPKDKVTAIQKLQTENSGVVAMVGDGINDAPALKTAEIGIAMGRGSDIALETADAALTHERLTELASMIRLSKNTAKIMRQNIIMALGINTFFLLTTLIGLTGLLGAVISDAGGSVLITLNALRLMNSAMHR
ncbi:MAG: heavy metal translocating P-type ATPase [Endozoicomonas sp. (ex Botrylloides leachii)]|nr:heavy metal translocating P-type ATPase [Endozoicomonas sp. (ex Botrylloides leachii)]